MYSLEKFCSIDAVSGDEGTLADLLCDMGVKMGLDSHIDNFGNVVISINGNSDATVMLDAHIDQIGLVVKEIDDNGFIKFIAAGGTDTNILPTAEVLIHGKENLYGVVGAKPLHLQTKDDPDNKKGIDDFYIDCGLPAEKIKNIVMPGDTISFVADFATLKNNYVTSKNLDNRVGVYVVSECLKRLKNHKQLPYNIVGLFSTQEEYGCRSAALAAETIKPDIAIVVDVTFGLTPYNDEETAFQTGGGITVAVGPNLDRKLADKLIDHCNKNNLKCTKEICNKNPGTNTWTIQVSGNGVRCILISVPIKYMHSTVETVCLDDINTAVEAICSVLKGGIL